MGVKPEPYKYIDNLHIAPSESLRDFFFALNPSEKTKRMMTMEVLSRMGPAAMAEQTETDRTDRTDKNRQNRTEQNRQNRQKQH